MPGRNDDFLLDQPARDPKAGIIFRGEGHDPHESPGGVEQALHRVEVGGPDRFPRMGAA